jgi:hypothetical protein
VALRLTIPTPTTRPAAPARVTGRDPYRVPGPAVVSVSGGRTSAYMLRRVLDAYGGRLPPDVHAVFANTGEEDPRTLDFVRDIQERWCPITWVEYDPDAEHGFREVEYETASRKGEPFAELIRQKRFLPNGRARFCTQELKIFTMAGYMRSLGYGDDWTNCVGLRWDEPKRVADHSARECDWHNAYPLYDDRVIKPTVRAFFSAQDFDLKTPEHLGNCTQCFLKGKTLRMHAARDAPEAAARFAAHEANVGARFIHKEPGGYAATIDKVRRLPVLPHIDPTDAESVMLPCDCTQ